MGNKARRRATTLLAHDGCSASRKEWVDCLQRGDGYKTTYTRQPFISVLKYLSFLAFLFFISRMCT